MISSSLSAKLGLAAVVLLMPGGSLVAASLAWRWWRARHTAG